MVTDDEIEDDEVSMKDNLDSDDGSDISEEDEVVETNGNSNPSRKFTTRMYRYCAYCYERTLRLDMIGMPKSNWRRRDWIESLGSQFELYISCFGKYPAVCKKHFNRGDFNKSGTKILVSAVPHKDDIYEGRQWYFDMKKKPCTYCEKRMPHLKLRNVPQGVLVKGIWARQLGEGFRRRMEAEKNPMICKSHIPDSMYSSPGKLLHLAVPLGLDEKEYPNSVNCAYCYTLNREEDTVQVPFGVYRSMWIDELGLRFKADIAKVEKASICKSHFKDYEKTVESDGIPFPIYDEYIFNMEKKAEKTKKTTKKDLITCVYCIKSRPRKEMTEVPLDEETIEIWSILLGVCFEYNIFKFYNPFICKSHFKNEDFDEKGNRRSGTTPILHNNVLNRYTSTNGSPTSICMHCKEENYLRNMRTVIECPQKREIWAEILEQKEFLERRVGSAICRKHFYIGKLENGAERYANVPHPATEDEDRIGLDVRSWSTQEFVTKEDGKYYITDLTANNTSDEVKVEENSEGEHQKENENAMASKESDDFCVKIEMEDLDEKIGLGIEDENDSKNTLELQSSSLPKSLEEDACVPQPGEKTFQRTPFKCVYCYGSMYIGQTYTLSDISEECLDECSVVFGIQFKTRMKYSSFSKQSVPKNQFLNLCKRHFNKESEPIADQNHLYSVDELLDHNYADFSRLPKPRFA